MSVHIAILVEGETEMVFKQKLNEFLEKRLPDRMPKIKFIKCDGRIPTGKTLRRNVEILLSGRDKMDAVIALTDVYTGTRDFIDAQDAKNKMRTWVGNERRFYPHVALHDFEAWLLPFWGDIQRLAGSNKSSFGVHPELVNHGKPPAHRLDEMFRTGSKGKRYVKTRDGKRILRDNDLAISANACPELKDFLDTILTLCGGQPVSAADQ
jgi:hypothetical protein